MDLFEAILVIYGGLWGFPMLFQWVAAQIEKKENARRVPSTTGLQSSTPATRAGTAWGCVSVCLIFIIPVVLDRVGKGDRSSPPSANLPFPAAGLVPAAYVPVPAPVTRQETMESLQTWYAELAARRSALAPGDQTAIQRFNVEAARFESALAAYQTEHAVISTGNALPDPGVYDAALGIPRPFSAEHYVNSYVRRDGSTTAGHYQTNPDRSLLNNYSTQGNTNPHTGQVGTIPSSGAASSHASRR